MDNQNNLFEGMKDALQERIKDAYIEGAKTGAITTCSIIYATMTAAGLEEDNFLFIMLKDIAKQHGCEDLPTAAAALREKHNH